MSDVTPVLEIIGLSKISGARQVLDEVDLVVNPGEVVGLADRAGMTKNALISLLSGTQDPDSGTIRFDGQRLNWPFYTRDHKISIIHAEPQLVDTLNVTENIFLGHEISWPVLGIPRQRIMDQRASEILGFLDVHLPSLQEKVANLSSEQKQLIAFAQMMARGSRLAVIDNPGRLLSYPYQEKVLNLIRQWRSENRAVLFSSTHLDHLFAVSDRIMVMRQGRIAANLPTDGTTREEIVEALVGTEERRQRTPVIWALDSYYRARRQAERLQHNQMLLRRDLAAQDNLNRQLIDQLADQVTALDSANLALQDAQRRLLTERELERKHLARELHDQIIQDLLSLNYQLEESAGKIVDSDDLSSDISDIRQLVRHMVEDLRRICGNLRPPTIDSFGLSAALKSYSQEWSDRTGIKAIFVLDKDLGRLPEEIELSIFRIVQESLSNIHRHADATEVTVTLEHTSPRMLLISIKDNGIGLEKNFDLSTMSRDGHYGLLGISERVALLGGRLNFHSRPEQGLMLQVEIPHPSVEQFAIS